MTSTHQAIQIIAIKEIIASSTNPRKFFDEAQLNDLAQSITEHGILSPILLRPNVKGGYELVAGERRLRASKIAKLTDIPAIVRELDDKSVLEIQVIENLQRSDLGAMEEAEGYRALIDKHGYTQTTLAAKVGKSVAFIAKRLQLTNLCESGKIALAEDKLPVGWAYLISRLADLKVQDKVVAACLSGLNIHSTKQLVTFIEDEGMRSLSKAPFKLADADLIPKVGACTTCPFNTSCAAELFDDYAEGAQCTNPSCYKDKISAFWKNTTSECEAKGAMALSLRDSKKLFDYNGRLTYGNTYVDSEDRIESTTWKKVVGKKLQPILALNKAKVYKLFLKSEAMAILHATPSYKAKHKESSQKDSSAPAMQDDNRRNLENAELRRREEFENQFIVNRSRESFYKLLQADHIEALRAATLTIKDLDGDQLGHPRRYAGFDGELSLKQFLGIASPTELVEYFIDMFVEAFFGDEPSAFEEALISNLGIDPKSLQAEIDSAYRESLLVPVDPKGICKQCGCTESNPCKPELGPCSWADANQDLCTACNELIEDVTEVPDVTPTQKDFSTIGTNPDMPFNEDGTKNSRPKIGDNYTLYWEERYNSEARTDPYSLNEAEAISAWRTRQEEGDIAPRWGEWSEFEVILKNGKSVTALYRPVKTGRTEWLEYHGPISSTGYYSQPINRGDDVPDIALFEFASNCADEIYSKHLTEHTKKNRVRKSKKEVAA
jgi:ParB/RepB/Spo0J family partition protein